MRIAQPTHAQDAKFFNGCEGKRRYLSEAEATDQARLAKRKFKRKLRTYFCSYCEGWHLTKQRKANG